MVFLGAKDFCENNNPSSPNFKKIENKSPDFYNALRLGSQNIEG
jgi:hypothetical protein